VSITNDEIDEIEHRMGGEYFADDVLHYIPYLIKEVRMLNEELFIRDAIWLPERDAEIEQLRHALNKERNAANDLLACIGKWAYKTAGQTMPTVISDAIFEFELQRTS